MKFPRSFLLLALLALACDKAPNPIAPGGTILTITANPTKISLFGESRLTISGFRPDGSRLNPGVLVRLSTSQGLLSTTIVEIGADGFAQATFKDDGRVGAATITARLTTDVGGGSGGSAGSAGGGGGTTVEASTTVQVDARKPKLLIAANPTSLRINESSTITVTARDENDLPLGAGEQILLTSNLGDLYLDFPIPNPRGPEISSALTGADGRAVFYFLAGTRSGSGSVGAVLRNSDQVSIAIDIRDAAASFTFTATPTTIPRNGGDVNMTVTVVNSDGIALSGTLVRFNSQLGGNFTPGNSVTTGSTGQAVTRLTLSSTDTQQVPNFVVSATVRINNQDLTQNIPITIQ
jgi:hypothetical protein